MKAVNRHLFDQFRGGNAHFGYIYLRSSGILENFCYKKAVVKFPQEILRQFKFDDRRLSRHAFESEFVAALTNIVAVWIVEGIYNGRFGGPLVLFDGLAQQLALAFGVPF